MPTTRADAFRFQVESYDQRRREVAAMIEEADAQDDTPAGPDALADALMEIAEGWCRSALAAADPAPAGASGDVEERAAAFRGALQQGSRAEVDGEQVVTLTAARAAVTGLAEYVRLRAAPATPLEPLDVEPES